MKISITVATVAALGVAWRSSALVLPPLTLAEYDYIVVGAGNAGLVAAARLSEDPSVTVAVIEAGDDYKSNLISTQLIDTPGADVLGPGYADSDFYDGAYDWGFKTAPQRGAYNKVYNYARGKTLGGSSTRNFMLMQRPTKGAMDKWVELTGDAMWSFDNRRDAFSRTFTYVANDPTVRNISTPNTAADFPGKGPVVVGYPNYPQPFSAYVDKAVRESGFAARDSFNQGSLLGAAYPITTTDPRDGKRTTSRAFYEQAKGRSNFKAYTATLAKRIVFDTTGAVPRASAVEVVNGLATFQLKARKEVIVSAGAFQSPQLLMVSGIGPKAQLDKVGVKQLVDLPGVGQNMQDHIFLTGPSWPVKVDTLTKVAANGLLLAADLGGFVFTGKGPLATNVADYLAWERIPSATATAIGAGVLNSYPADWPHIETFSAPGYVGDFANLFDSNKQANAATGKQFATIMNAIVAPRSRGTVSLRSADTKDLPTVDPAWLTDPVDQAVAIHAFKRLRTFFAAPSMQPVLDGPEYYPGAGVQSDAQILDFVRRNLMTVWHAACTCAMGKREAGGVLDSKLRVYGVQGLRVADASAFPILPAGHPQSTAYMVGETVAELIKAGK